MVDTGKIGSVLTPQKSAEGKEYYVESFGEKVKELSVGDRVTVIGNKESLIFLPGDKDRFIPDQANLVLVYEKELH